MFLVTVCIATFVQQAASLAAKVGHAGESKLVQALGRHTVASEDAQQDEDAPVPFDLVPAWVGCFTNNHTDREFKMRLSGKQYNASTCMRACLKKGRLQFALIYDGDCNCGLPDVHEGVLQRARGKTCGRVCASEVGKSPTHYCGDADKRAVYKASGLNSSWVGCFRNSKPAALTVQRHGARYTTASCMQACFGYSYMALQGSSAHCFCGNKNGEPTERYRRVADSECGGACAGEEGPGLDRRCGTQEHTAVYRLQSHALSGSEARMVNENMRAGGAIAAPSAGQAAPKAQAAPSAGQAAPKAQGSSGDRASTASDASKTAAKAAGKASKVRGSSSDRADTVSGVNGTAVQASKTLDKAVQESEVEEVTASKANATVAEVKEATPTAANESEIEEAKTREMDTAAAKRKDIDSVVEAKAQEIREATNIVEMMSKLDIDGDYIINRDELSMALSMVDPDRWTVVEVQMLLYGLDTNQDDKLQFEEIAPWLATASEIKDLGSATAVKTDTAAILKQHATGALDRLLTFDLNGDKQITLKELSITLKMEGHGEWTSAAVKNLLRKFDHNSDHVLQYAEFLPWIMYQDGMKSSTKPNSKQTRRLDRGNWKSK